jgi:hypothetical protein
MSIYKITYDPDLVPITVPTEITADAVGVDFSWVQFSIGDQVVFLLKSNLVYFVEKVK